jgi:hypothetical protein
VDFGIEPVPLCIEGYANQKGDAAVSVCTWAQDERPADLHMAQPNVPVSKTGQFPPAKLIRGGRAMPCGTIGSTWSHYFLNIKMLHMTFFVNAGRKTVR